MNEALSFNPSSEVLIIKALKLEEKLQNPDGARALLGRSRPTELEGGWKILVEGALFEARNGNVDVARFVFKYLCQTVGNVFVFHQTALLEEKYHNFEAAIEYAEKGLRVHPRYGPIWFTLLRLYERICHGDLTNVYVVASKAVAYLPKELCWKLYFELAQIEDRFGRFKQAREAYVQAVSLCPKHLQWKIWLAGAHTELRSQTSSLALIHKLLQRSLDQVPKKKCAQVFIDWARIEEGCGNLEEARKILERAKKEAKFEWKVFLEGILLEMRHQNLETALRQVEEALLVHTGTGRLWALYIQLNQLNGFQAQMAAFRKALHEVPKSGEVWLFLFSI